MEFDKNFNKRFDWGGLERTFKKMLSQLKMKMETQYNTQKKRFVRQRIQKTIINIICLVILIGIMRLMPIGFKTFIEKTGYFQKPEQVETMEDDAPIYDDVTTEVSQPDVLMEIIATTANIRSGPGKDYEVITTAATGTVFIATGNQETASNGRIWYERNVLSKT